MPKPKIDIDLSEINDEPIEHKTIQKNIEPSKFNHLLHAGNIFQRAVEKVTSKLHEIKSDEKPAEDPNMPKKAKNGSKRPLVVPVPDSMISLNGKKNNKVLEDEEITETDESDSEIIVGQDQTIPEENLTRKPFLFLLKFRVYVHQIIRFLLNLTGFRIDAIPQRFSEFVFKSFLRAHGLVPAKIDFHYTDSSFMIYMIDEESLDEMYDKLQDLQIDGNQVRVEPHYDITRVKIKGNVFQNI